MNNYKVYCLTNSITNEKYIGTTKQKMYDRFKAGKGYKPTTKINLAIEKYGWENFTHKILCETNSKYIAGEMEKYYIQEFDTINNGYNYQSGGYANFINPMKEETKIKQSIIQKGRHYSPETEFKKGVKTQYVKSIMKPVLCVETGIVYDSIKQAQDKLKLYHIWDCINGKRNICGGYHWELAKEVE